MCLAGCSSNATLGKILLFAILTIAVAWFPALGAFGHQPSQLNTWEAYFPFVWLPSGLVSAALFS